MWCPTRLEMLLSLLQRFLTALKLRHVDVISLLRLTLNMAYVSSCHDTQGGRESGVGVAYSDVQCHIRDSLFTS